MSYQPYTDWQTSKGNVARHLHWDGQDVSPQKKRQLRRKVERDYSGARVLRDATYYYNCHGYAHAARHAWFNEINQFIEDDYYLFTPGRLFVDDIVVYSDGTYPTHSGVITRLSGNSVVEVRSKWGAWPEVLHAPATVPAVYGSIMYYLRRRGTRTMEEIEPSEDAVREKIEDLLISIAREERLARIGLASTPMMARAIVAQFPEMRELLLYGSKAGQAISDRLNYAEGDELAVLAYAIAMLSHLDALPALAARVADLPEDGAVSMSENLLLSAFESLSTADKSDRRSRLTEAARSMLEGDNLRAPRKP